MIARGYESYVCPSIEYASVTYASMLTKKEKAKLEKLQDVALKLIFGSKKSYRKVCDENGMDTLETRRNNTALQPDACRVLC